MLKVAVIGGGSTYTPELINGFIERENQFPLDELWLMDIDEERLNIIGQFAKRMASAKKAGFNIKLSTDQRQAIDGASYVITQLRVGQMEARREDEYLGKRYGIIGQETTGVGGMAKALRTIPVILEIARDIQELAPNAILINFSNPSGLVTEALFRYAPEVLSIGVCNSALTTKMEILNKLNRKLGTNFSDNEAEIKTLGLNHLTWYYGFTIDGKDYWPLILAEIISEQLNTEDPYFDPDTLETLQMLPNSYLRYYYYTDKMIQEQKDWPPSRAEEVMKIEAELLEAYQDQELSEPPEELMQRGGAYYSTVATQLINAHYNDLNEIHVVNTRNNGAVPGWDNEWVLEIPCQINAKGVFPMPISPLPPECESLVSTVKAYEIFTVQAAVEGNRIAAYKALLTHPLGPAADKITPFLKDMFEINKPYLPNFFNE